jgi:hypothetical protein
MSLPPLVTAVTITPRAVKRQIIAAGGPNGDEIAHRELETELQLRPWEFIAIPGS